MSILVLVKAIVIAHDIRQGGITIGLDGEQAMKEASGQWDVKDGLNSDVMWTLNPSQPSYDLLCEIRHRIHALPLMIS